MCFVHKTANNYLILVSFGPSLTRDLVVIHVRLRDNKAKLHKEERQIIRLQEGIKHLKKNSLPICVLLCMSLVHLLFSCPWLPK